MSDAQKKSQFAAAVAMLNKSDNSKLGASFSELNELTKSSHRRKSQVSPKSSSASPPFPLQFSPEGRKKNVKHSNPDNPLLSYLDKHTSSTITSPKSRTHATPTRPTQSYIGRGNFTPNSAKKSSVPSFNGLPFTPSPSSVKSHVDLKRGANPAFSPPLVGPGSSSSSIFTLSPTPSRTKAPKKHSISFQAASPLQQKKKNVLSNSNHYGGSYMHKGSDTSGRSKQSSGSKSRGMGQIADIKIEAKIPNVEQKLAARRKARENDSTTKYAHEMEDDDKNLPEAVRKFRQREKARQAALDEQQQQAEQKIFAIVIGWYRRKQYPALLKVHEERLRKIAEKHEQEARQERAAISLQAAWRTVLPRREFKRLIAIRRRREKNQRRIREIEKIIKDIPKSTKSEVKEMKKECAAKKKEMKKNLKLDVKDEDKKLDEIRKQGSNMIDYLKDEKKKFRELKAQLKKDTKVAEREAVELKQKGDELAERFQSLRGFAEKKAQSVQKREIASSKCRNRYLPKYRSELAERNKFCISEHRVKMLYKTNLTKIVKGMQGNRKDPDIVSEVVGMVLECEAELNRMPEVPIPPDLKQFM